MSKTESRVSFHIAVLWFVTLGGFQCSCEMLIPTDKNIRCQNSEDHCVLNCANYVLVAGSFEYGNSISAYIKGRKFLYITVRKGFFYFPAACMGPKVWTVF